MASRSMPFCSTSAGMPEPGIASTAIFRAASAPKRTPWRNASLSFSAPDLRGPVAERHPTIRSRRLHRILAEGAPQRPARDLHRIEQGSAGRRLDACAATARRLKRPERRMRRAAERRKCLTRAIAETCGNSDLAGFPAWGDMAPVWIPWPSWCSVLVRADLGITPEVRDDHAAYIASWLEKWRAGHFSSNREVAIM